MNEFTKTALSAEIKASWLMKFDTGYIAWMKRRGNKTGFFITIFCLMLLLFVSRWFALPFIAFGWFMCFTSIASGVKERRWAKKYNLLVPEVVGLIQTVFNS